MKNRDAVIEFRNEVEKERRALSKEIERIEQSLLRDEKHQSYETRQRPYERAIRYGELREQAKWTKKKLDKILMGWVW